jgi:hypothetical protein
MAAAAHPRAAAKARYGPLVDNFAFYASYHNNFVNQLIHISVRGGAWRWA